MNDHPQPHDDGLSPAASAASREALASGRGCSPGTTGASTTSGMSPGTGARSTALRRAPGSGRGSRSAGIELSAGTG